jgi:hypothetical protein
MSPEWREDFKFAVQEANRLGLELCVENCAGWSSSGGPWNTVTNAMQRVTTSEVRVTGPTNFSAALPQPPTTLGFLPRHRRARLSRARREGVRMKDFSPVASASGDEPPGDKLTDGDSRKLHSPARAAARQAAICPTGISKTVFGAHGENHRRAGHARMQRRDSGFR